MSRTISATACRWSAEAVASRASWVYLWTFTTPTVVTGREIGMMWRTFVNQLTHIHRGALPSFCGLRVFEPHPGGHGWHVHCVVREWFDVNVIRAVAEHHGFGRINVKKIPGSEAGYVAKYVAKSNKSNERARGMRVWSVFNKRSLRAAGVVWERVSDLVVTSDSLSVFRRAFHFASLLSDRWQAKRDFATAEVLRWLCGRPSAIPADYRFVWSPKKDAVELAMEGGSELDRVDTLPLDRVAREAASLGCCTAYLIDRGKASAEPANLTAVREEDPGGHLCVSERIRASARNL